MFDYNTTKREKEFNELFEFGNIRHRELVSKYDSIKNNAKEELKRLKNNEDVIKYLELINSSDVQRYLDICKAIDDIDEAINLERINFINCRKYNCEHKYLLQVSENSVMKKCYCLDCKKIDPYPLSEKCINLGRDLNSKEINTIQMIYDDLVREDIPKDNISEIITNNYKVKEKK